MNYSLSFSNKDFEKLEEEINELVKIIFLTSLERKFKEWRKKKKEIKGKEVKVNEWKSFCDFPDCERYKKIVNWDFFNEKPVLLDLCNYHNEKKVFGLITKFSDGYNWNYAQWKSNKSLLPVDWVPATSLFINLVKLSGNDKGSRSRKIVCEDCGQELFGLKRRKLDKWGEGFFIKLFKRSAFFVGGKVCCYRCAVLNGWGGEK